MTRQERKESLGLMTDEGILKRNIIKGAVFAVFVLLGLIVLFGTFYTIRSGQEGVLLTFNKAEPVPVYPGLHTKIPLVQKVVKFNVQTQKYGLDATQNSLLSAASKDLQVVKVRIALNYHLAGGKTPDIFTNIGPGYEDKVILPSLQESVKSSVSLFNAADLINKRQDVSTLIEQTLREKLSPYNIIVEQVSITDLDYSEQFNAAIEAKVTAEQQAFKAENDLKRIAIEAQQREAVAEGEKQAVIKAAEADAERVRLSGQADAERIRLAQEQLARSPQYVEYVKAQRWNGVLPAFYMAGGSDSAPLIMQLPQLTTTN